MRKPIFYAVCEGFSKWELENIPNRWQGKAWERTPFRATKRFKKLRCYLARYTKYAQNCNKNFRDKKVLKVLFWLSAHMQRTKGLL